MQVRVFVESNELANAIVNFLKKNLNPDLHALTYTTKKLGAYRDGCLAIFDPHVLNHKSISFIQSQAQALGCKTIIFGYRCKDLDDRDILNYSMQLGVDALISQMGEENLMRAIEVLSKNEKYQCPEIQKFMQSISIDVQSKPFAKKKDEMSEVTLSPREVEILSRLSLGKSNKQVAAELGISTRTVESHRANIMKRLNANHFADVVRYAVDRKFIV